MEDDLTEKAPLTKRQIGGNLRKTVTSERVQARDLNGIDTEDNLTEKAPLTKRHIGQNNFKPKKCQRHKKVKKSKRKPSADRVAGLISMNKNDGTNDDDNKGLLIPNKMKHSW